MKLTHSLEEYLKTMYILQNTEKHIRVTDIAKKLNITKPSVNRGIKNLKELELIKYEVYGDILLTESGKKTAEQIIKKQDVLELFLIQILNLPKEIAQKDAATMKNAISNETELELEKYIYKILKLNNLNCGFNIENQRCRNCARIRKDK